MPAITARATLICSTQRTWPEVSPCRASFVGTTRCVVESFMSVWLMAVSLVNAGLSALDLAAGFVDAREVGRYCLPIVFAYFALPRAENLQPLLVAEAAVSHDIERRPIETRR